jgi:hypothetical protein
VLDEAIWRYEARFDGARPRQLQVPIDTTPLLQHAGIPIVGVAHLHYRGGLWQVAAGPALGPVAQAPLWPGPDQLALPLEDAS